VAQEQAEIRRERFGFTREVKEWMLRCFIQEQWSPEQIAGRARREGISMVSHERIYRFIREDRAQGGDLYKHLRHRLKHRKRAAGGKKVIVPDKVSIDS
jgi:IS30 family transposase